VSALTPRDQWARKLAQAGMLDDENNLPGDTTKYLLLEGLRMLRTSSELQARAIQKIECAVASSSLVYIGGVIKEAMTPCAATVSPPPKKEKKNLTPIGLKEGEKRKYKCPLCGTVRGSSSAVRKHMIEEHNEGEGYECPDCYFKTNSKDVMRKHVKVCTKKRDHVEGDDLKLQVIFLEGFPKCISDNHG